MFFFILGCVQDINRPDLGECAQYPDGKYDFGQIDIGSCISGPTEFQFIGTGEDQTLLISNANPYLNFTGGSLLAIPWSEILSAQDNTNVDTLNPQALPLPSFVAPIENIGTDTVMVGVRYSEGATDRVHDDTVYLFDIEDPQNIQRKEEEIIVQSDPVSIAYDKSSALAFVANRTSHNISIIDTTLSPMEVIPPWPIEQMGEAEYDGSGNTKLSALSPLTQELLNTTEEVPPLTDDLWEYTWIEGTYSLWLPQEDGWIRTENQGLGTYQNSEFGVELTPSDFLLADSIENPFYFGGAILFSNDNSIYSTLWNDETISWDYDGLPLVSFEDRTLNGFSYFQTSTTSEIVYAAQTDKGWGIYKHILGTDTSDDVEIVFSESSALADPCVLYEKETKQWHMVFAQEAPHGWHILEATSTDKETWSTYESSILDFEENEHAAPVFTRSSKGLDLWYAKRGEDGWSYAHAFSKDGTHWTEQDTDLTLVTEEPLRPALKASPNLSFRLSSAEVGLVSASLPPTVPYMTLDYGWSGTIITGMTLDEDAFSSESAGGVEVSSSLEELVYLSISNRAQKQSIALGRLNDDLSVSPASVLLSDENDSLYSPLVWKEDGQFHMLYTRSSAAGIHAIEHSTSSDGIEWSTGSSVLQSVGGTQAIEASSINQEDGVYTLWLSIEDNDGWNIYTAQGNTLDEWSLGSTPAFAQGPTGAWDDNGVRDPQYIVDTDTTHLLYSGFNGSAWEIGYARKTESGWERFQNLDDVEHPILESTGFFYSEGVQKAVPIFGYKNQFFYSGIQDGIPRVGRASGHYPTHLAPAYMFPSPGDSLQFTTTKGSEDIDAIPLDIDTADLPLTGVGLGGLHIDQEKGFLYAVSKLLPYIIVIDIRDDSTEDFDDRNYLDVEATIAFSTSSGAIGFRQVLTSEDKIYAINDAPESIFIIDGSTVEDNATHELIRDAFQGWLPAPRGAERDEGDNTRMSLGPGQMALQPNGNLLALSNFNANSVSIYNLNLGPNGQLIDEIPLYTENPYAISFSPDGLRLVVGSYTGDIDGNFGNSSLITINTDPNDASYLNIQNRIVNK